MDWIKIKPSHILWNGYSHSQIGVLVVLQCLVAHLERLPSEKEMKKVVHWKQLENIKNALNDRLTQPHNDLNEPLIDPQCTLNDPSMGLQYVLNKVLTDVQHARAMRAKGKEKMAKLREKSKPVTNNVTGNVADIDKIREDKIREDKSIYPPTPLPANAGTPQAELVESWKALYQAKTGQPYNATARDYVLAAKLLKKFSADQVIEKAKLLFDFCQRGDVWFAKSMADFTISKLSSMWNQIIKEAQNGAGISERELASFMSGRE